MPNLPLCHWSSQLFNLRAPSSTDVPVLLLNQPNKEFIKGLRRRWLERQKAIGSMSKITSLHVHHTFWYISCRHCAVTTWNCPISRLMADVNERRWIVLPFNYGLNAVSNHFSPGKFACTSQVNLVGIMAMKFERTRIWNTFCETLSIRSSSGLCKLLDILSGKV